MLNNISNLVVVFQGTESMATQVLEELNLPISVTVDPLQADLLTSQMKKPVIIVELSEDLRESKEMLTKLLNSINLPLFPLLIIGHSGISLEQKKQINNVYSKVNILEVSNFPANAENIRTIIQRGFQDLIPGTYPNENRTPESTPEVIFRPDALSDSTKLSNIEQFKSSIPQTILSQMPDAGKKQLHLNGDIYSGLKELDSLTTSDYLPVDSRFLATVNKVEEECSEWEIIHFHRTSFTCFNILKTLNITTQNLELARASSLLYFFPSAIGSENITRMPYIRSGQKDRLQKIIDSLYANATSFKEQNNLKDIAPIVSCIANCLAGKTFKIAENLEIFQIASSILVADLIDRECWQSGIWNAAAGLTVIRWVEKKGIHCLDPTVIYQSTRFLVEAFEANAQTLQKTKLRDHNTVSITRLEKNTETNQLCPISELIPGMRLAHPLLMHDGRQILENGIPLDSDLIWRIWRLSALHPIEHLVVAKK
jgi:hypothetical protein